MTGLYPLRLDEMGLEGFLQYYAAEHCDFTINLTNQNGLDFNAILESGPGRPVVQLSMVIPARPGELITVRSTLDVLRRVVTFFGSDLLASQLDLVESTLKDTYRYVALHIQGGCVVGVRMNSGGLES